MTTRKLRRTLSRWVCNTCSIGIGAFRSEVPYDFRYFKTRDDAGNIVSRNWSQLGDIRIEGIYTGFMADLSAGVTFGVKLPTGSYTLRI